MSIILAVSDVVWQAAIAAVLAIGLAWINRKVSKIVKTGDDVHTLVNSAMGAQLKLNAVSTQRLAMMTHSPVDVEAAALAEKALKEHQARQSVVNGA